MEKRKSWDLRHRSYLLLLCAFFFVLACWFVPECDEYYFQYWSFDSLSDFIHTNPRDTGVLLVGIPANGRYLGNALGILQAKLYAAPGGVYLRAALFAACSIGLLRLLYGYFFQMTRISQEGDKFAEETGQMERRRLLKSGGFALCVLLLVGAPYGIYSQVLAWGAGFANYVPPAAAMVFLWLNLFGKEGNGEGRVGEAEKDGKKVSLGRRIVLFLVAFAAQLFAEPVTVYFLFFGAALTADGWIWYRKMSRLQGGEAAAGKVNADSAAVVGGAVSVSSAAAGKAAAWRRTVLAAWMFLGFLAGAALMFSDSGYRQVGGDGRAVTVENMVRNLAIIASEVVVNHPLITPLLSLLLIAAAFCSLREKAERRWESCEPHNCKSYSCKSRGGKSHKSLAYAVWLVLTVLLIPLHVFLFRSNALVITDQLFAYENVNIFVGAAIAAIWIGLLVLWSMGGGSQAKDDGSCVTVWDGSSRAAVKNGGRREAARPNTYVHTTRPCSYAHTVRGRLWFWVGSLVVANGPLLILYPIKSRHFFFSYIILCLVALELYGWLAERITWLSRKKMTRLIQAATIACCVGLLFVYCENNRVHQERMAYAKEQIAAGASEVTLPLLPYRAFVTNEGTSKGDISYVCYREKPWDVKFHFVLWEEWKGYENE